MNTFIELDSALQYLEDTFMYVSMPERRKLNAQYEVVWTV
jgi:hypothetical protein